MASPHWLTLKFVLTLNWHHCQKNCVLLESSRVTIRDWSGLTTLPDWIGSLTSLTDLEIGPCPELTSLREELRSFRILKRLTIHDWSGLTTLPDWIGNLSSLEELRIRACPKLTSLPERCVPSQPSTGSKSLTVHIYPKYFFWKKSGPILLMSQQLFMSHEWTEAESHFRSEMYLSFHSLMPLFLLFLQSISCNNMNSILVIHVKQKFRLYSHIRQNLILLFMFAPYPFDDP